MDCGGCACLYGIGAAVAVIPLVKNICSTLTAVQNADVTSRATGNDNLHAIIKLRPQADVQSVAADTSVRVMTVAGNLATCVLPASSIDRLAAHPDVEWIDTGSEVVLMADIAREITGVNLLRSSASGYPVVYNGVVASGRSGTDTREST